tara:strand:- start:354 stop:566 length:213 start_codon:yes stop_codon:yes gene_type:complete
MYRIYHTIAEYEHTEIDANSIEFKVQKYDGDVVDVVVDTTASREQLALGGTLESYNADVIGHLLYALENT